MFTVTRNGANARGSRSMFAVYICVIELDEWTAVPRIVSGSESSTELIPFLNLEFEE